MEYLGIILAVALLFGLLMLFFIFRTSTGSKSKGLNKIFVQERWKEIELYMSQGGPANFQSAVIEADKLFDYVLKSVVGDNNDQNMADRLKLSQKKFSSWEVYQGIWSAHKVRNRSAHEMDHELNSAVARNAIEQFKKGLRDLRLL